MGAMANIGTVSLLVDDEEDVEVPGGIYIDDLDDFLPRPSLRPTQYVYVSRTEENRTRMRFIAPRLP